jgi:4-alpha-glucanotransferase
VVTVLAAPARLPGIETLTGAEKLWGINLALYGLQSARNTGLGDFEDLAQMGEGAGASSAGFMGINPLHAMGHCDDTAISPYSPSHRGFLNTSYIALDRVPGLRGAPDMAAFEGMRRAETLQYGAHKTAHKAALETLFADFNSAAAKDAKTAFKKFKTDHAAELDDFIRYEALSEVHGPDWQTWPKKTKAAPAKRKDFHAWLQWVATCQLEAAQTRAKAAGMALGLYLDLAVGSRRDGAEAWCAQAVVAQGVSIGAPPDHLSPEGQNWNLTAFSPRKLQAERYRSWRRIIAQVIRHAGLMRIDHVLGLNRSFWIPDDGSPGAYIRQPFESLLAVLKIEAEHHQCAIVGEDLGLVPEGFRDTMQGHGFYGYSVLQYEKDEAGHFRDPADIPAQGLSCFATHDTPTVTGYETGRDIAWGERLNWVDEATAKTMRARRHAEVDAFKGGKDFTGNVHARLAYSPAALVAVQLDDILKTAEAQNLPGTIDEHPNWRRKYGAPLENLLQEGAISDTAEIMRATGRDACTKGSNDED